MVNTSKPSDKKCPHCDEEIQAAAKVCKHCHRDVQPSKPAWWEKPVARVSAVVLFLLAVAGFMFDRCKEGEIDVSGARERSAVQYALGQAVASSAGLLDRKADIYKCGYPKCAETLGQFMAREPDANSPGWDRIARQAAFLGPSSLSQPTHASDSDPRAPLLVSSDRRLTSYCGVRSEDVEQLRKEYDFLELLAMHGFGSNEPLPSADYHRKLPGWRQTMIDLLKREENIEASTAAEAAAAISDRVSGVRTRLKDIVAKCQSEREKTEARIAYAEKPCLQKLVASKP